MFKLKRINKQFKYYIEPMISEHKLRNYNVHVINDNILEMKDNIEIMYEFNCSHIGQDVMGLTSQVTRVDKLVIYIDEEKRRLAQYKRISNKNLKILNNIVAKYSPKDRLIIKQYFKKLSAQPENEVIQRLRKDLYVIENARRNRRNATRKFIEEKEMNNYVEELQNKLEVISL